MPLSSKTPRSKKAGELLLEIAQDRVERPFPTKFVHADRGSDEIQVGHSFTQELFDQATVVFRDANQFGSDPGLEIRAEVIDHRAKDEHHDEKGQQEHPDQDHPADVPESLPIPALLSQVSLCSISFSRRRMARGESPDAF